MKASFLFCFFDIKYHPIGENKTQRKEAFLIMIKQSFLPFKIGVSRDILTSRSGLTLYSEF